MKFRKQCCLQIDRCQPLVVYTSQIKFACLLIGFMKSVGVRYGKVSFVCFCFTVGPGLGLHGSFLELDLYRSRLKFFIELSARVGRG